MQAGAHGNVAAAPASCSRAALVDVYDLRSSCVLRSVFIVAKVLTGLPPAGRFQSGGHPPKFAGVLLKFAAISIDLAAASDLISAQPLFVRVAHA
jgi:hypothetical protein